MGLPVDTTRTDSTATGLSGRGLALWVGSTMVGVPLVYLLPQQALALLDAEGGVLLVIWGVAGGLCGALAGVLVGQGQRLALRGSVPWAARWAGCTILGWAIGGALLMCLTRVTYAAPLATSDNSLWVLGTLAWPAAGVAIGAAQWALLRRYVARAAWWVVVTGLAWEFSAVGVGIAYATATSLLEAGGMVGVAVVLFLAGAGAGGLAGVVTALALNMLIAHNQGHKADPSA